MCQSQMERFIHLVILVSLSDAYAANNVAVVYGIEGESVSINCTYNPKENQWREKSWCRHISKTVCQHVVSARRFWMPFLKRRNGTTSIADNIQNGILTVTINPLKKEDAGLYQYKADFLGSMSTLCKVKLKVLRGTWKTEAPEEPRAVYSISSTIGTAGINLHFVVAGFLGFKCLVVIFLLIIAWSQKNRRLEDGSRRENEHQLLSFTGDITSTA
ncbi:PREDICTED: triggering receptor expressed on myeloid cells 2-like isoform X2 [Gekko japonicus]|uniref:Triggering receptor expressed on myeloid cells 2-like isoform X2 n=1 Tax=Gekko japonicus TaxID=146911 RepID=A0ABM1K3A6_GEKJA|nr:PREDICTED: triggering receptor expressed on myeloid cells 2-like isoform X2 [Gekko japonicus]